MSLKALTAADVQPVRPPLPPKGDAVLHAPVPVAPPRKNKDDFRPGTVGSGRDPVAQPPSHNGTLTRGAGAMQGRPLPQPPERKIEFIALTLKNKQ